MSSIFKRDRASSTGAAKYAPQSDRASLESRDSDAVAAPEEPTASFARSQSSSLQPSAAAGGKNLRLSCVAVKIHEKLVCSEVFLILHFTHEGRLYRIIIGC